MRASGSRMGAGEGWMEANEAVKGLRMRYGG